MKNFISFDRLLLLGIVLFLAILFFNHSCSQDNEQNINQLNNFFEQNERLIAGIDSNIKSLKNDVKNLKEEIDSLDLSRALTINRFNYEISRMEDVFRTSADTLIVNAYLRCWSERLYRLPGFFQSSPDNPGTAAISKDITTGGKLLSSDE